MRAFGVLLVAIAVAGMLALSVQSTPWQPGIAFGVLLVIAGVALLERQEERR